MTDPVVDPIELRRVLGHFATGVTVVTTRHLSGGGCGLTANAFTSVSLAPPLILVCVDQHSATFACLRENRFFAASILAHPQHELSHRFAERRDDKFEGIPHHVGVTGAPILNGALGHVECLTEAEYEAGDHTILVGRVVSAGAAGGEPLVFFRGGYTTVRSPAGGDEPPPGEREP